jgi:hypothetical protein
MKRHELRRDSALKQWFCLECGRISNHVGKLTAEDELNKFDCVDPRKAKANDSHRIKPKRDKIFPK